MLKKCQELEKQVKNVGNNPVLAKEIHLKLAECYEKNHDSKKAGKTYEKVAKIIFDTAIQFEDPEEARKLFEEAISYYNKIKKSKESIKCKQKIGEAYVTAAKRLQKSRQRMIYAIKYLNSANEIYTELKEKDKIEQNKQFINLIQNQIGVPLEELNNMLKEYPKPVLIREPPILEKRDFERRKKEYEQKLVEEAKNKENELKLEKKKRRKEEIERERRRVEEEQKYKKEILTTLVKEGKTAEEIKEVKATLEKFEKEEKSQLSAIDQLLKKKEG